MIMHPSKSVSVFTVKQISHCFQLLLACLDSHQHGTLRSRVSRAVRTGHMNMGCPAEFICPITQEVMTDPVMVSETGQVRSESRRTTPQYVSPAKSSQYIHGRCC